MHYFESAVPTSRSGEQYDQQQQILAAEEIAHSSDSQVLPCLGLLEALFRNRCCKGLLNLHFQPADQEGTSKCIRLGRSLALSKAQPPRDAFAQMSKCPFLLLVVGGPTFEDDFAPVFLVHPCVPAVVVLGCPAYVPRVQAPGLIADVVCGYVTSIYGLPICPPADDGHQRDGPALLTLRVSAQGLELRRSYGGAALEFVPDEGLDQYDQQRQLQGV